MSRGQQTITAGQLAELEALTPIVEAPKPSAAPIPVKDPPGMASVEATCPQHGVGYLRTYIHGLRSTVGQCPTCLADADLERKAREILESREAEYKARVQTLLDASEQDRSERVERRLAPFIAEKRSELAGEELSQDLQRALGDVEAEMLNEIRQSQREAR